ncbi:MAG: hypothetical protein WCS43_05675 [Verrucomicrobiota bacterium]
MFDIRGFQRPDSILRKTFHKERLTFSREENRSQNPLVFTQRNLETAEIIVQGNTGMKHSGLIHTRVENPFPFNASGADGHRFADHALSQSFDRFDFHRAIALAELCEQGFHVRMICHGRFLHHLGNGGISLGRGMSVAALTRFVRDKHLRHSGWRINTRNSGFSGRM